MMDSCEHGSTAKEVQKSLIRNLYRFHRAGRVPFPLYLHASWFERNAGANLEGFKRFVRAVLAKVPGAYFVTQSQLVDWVRYPMTLEEMEAKDKFGCKK